MVTDDQKTGVWRQGSQGGLAAAGLAKLDACILLVVKAVALLTGLALAILMVVQVALRYWLQRPILGIEEISVLFGLWFYFLGAAYATRQDGHIKGGLARVLFRASSTLRVVRALATAISLLASLGFCYLAIAYWQAVLTSGRSSAYLAWPTTLWVGSMVVGFILMAVYLLAQTVTTCRGDNGACGEHGADDEC